MGVGGQAIYARRKQVNPSRHGRQCRAWMRYASAHQLPSHRGYAGLEEQCSEYRHQDWGWVRLAHRGLPERLVAMVVKMVVVGEEEEEGSPSSRRMWFRSHHLV